MSTESKVRIYKTNVRPVLTYASETRAETTYTQQLLRTTEMKTIRAFFFKFHCFTVHFVSLSFIYTNVCTCF